MTVYDYDLEFLEDGKTIDLISIGIHCQEDGREYYAVNEECAYDSRPWYHRWFNRKGSLNNRIRSHEWLMENVVPSLPRLHGDARNYAPQSWLFDYFSPLVKPRARIAAEVKDFLLAKGAPELWADYGAYDHVALCQLWGRMIDLPAGIPMFTRDIQQEAARLGVGWDEFPKQAEGNHNALADARHNAVKRAYLRSVAASTKESP
jgi:hypothetical protein